jgi:3'(2'), 5'-bisphosphate nucleotidase
MRTQPPPTILRAAIDTVADACRVARAIQQNVEQVRRITKDDRSPVTVADFAVQAVVRLGLAMGEESPLIAGEEHGAALRDPTEGQAAVRDAVVEAVQAWREHVTAEEVIDAIDACDHDARGEAYWTLDPIDGTKGFLRGQQYAIALARIENGQVTLAVMGCPNLGIDQGRDVDDADPHGTIYVASRGGGAWELRADKPRAEPGRVTRPAETADPPRLCESVESAHSSQSDSARIMHTIGSEASAVRLDSQCKYAVVARGQADVYLRIPTKKGYVERIWDHAAGMLIAQEAGAVVTDIDGKPLDFTHGRGLAANRGIVCAAEAIHPRLIDAIGRLGL